MTRFRKKPPVSAFRAGVSAAWQWPPRARFGRKFEGLGHDVRLIPQVYVTPFVKRQRNDAADAEAIVKTGVRPTMRSVAVKTEDQQAQAMLQTGPGHAVAHAADVCWPAHPEDQCFTRPCGHATTPECQAVETKKPP